MSISIASITRFLGLLAGFVFTFAVGAFWSQGNEDPLFVIGLSCALGALVGTALLAGVGRKNWSNRPVPFLAALIGLLAFPGLPFATTARSALVSGLSAVGTEGRPSFLQLAVEVLVLGGYWFALPYLLGRLARRVTSNAP